MLMFAVLLAGCGADGEEPGPCREVELRILDSAGQPLDALYVTSSIGVADCRAGDPGAAGYVCSSGRVVMANPGDTITYSAKSRGYETAISIDHALSADQDAVPVEALTGVCAGRQVFRSVIDVEMTPLAEFTSTTHYATGFASEFNNFSALVYPSRDDLGQADVVKFIIENVDSAPQVYFQNTLMHPLHYDFFHNVLGRAVDMREFTEITYSGRNRKNIAGSLIYRPAAVVQVGDRTVTGVITIEFFPTDDLTPEQAGIAYRLLEARMGFVEYGGDALGLVYLPPGSTHEAHADAWSGELSALGVDWIHRDGLYAGITEQFLNPGVSYGTLRLVSAVDLDKIPISFMDILVLPRLPNDLPLVGGTITGELQTPLAHVNVAARARDTPNMAMIGVATDPRITPFFGKLVRFEVKSGAFTLSEADPAEAQAFWDEKLDRPPMTPRADLTRTGLLDLESIGFDDSVAVGVKAANVAELIKIIPDETPRGFAVPFSYYEDFIKQTVVPTSLFAPAGADCIDEGRDKQNCDDVVALLETTGGEETIAEMLSRVLEDPEFQTDSVFRYAVLDAIQYVYCKVPIDAEFAGLLDARVREQFPDAPVRLRSSTNAEDLTEFTGAGLYDSVSAQIDTDKPPSERICRVWRSVWNFKAFEERAFWNVEHLAVKMAVLIHDSFPNEAANGVLLTQNIADPFTVGMYANVQKGETSVTNPENGAFPEIITLIPGPEGVQVARRRFSSLSPNTPILSDEEVQALYGAADMVQHHFAPLYGKSEYNITLDIEFKFNGPQRDLILKQVRPYQQ